MNRIIYIPHPNYITAYTDTKPYTNYIKRKGELVLLFMGSISPYKNIGRLIEAAAQLQTITDMHFLICGGGNKDYQNQLLTMIHSSNITTDLGTWTGTTRDIDESFVYCYDDSQDEAEHITRLKDAIMRFYEDFKRDKASVKAKGEKLREIMRTEHSLEKVAEGLAKAYA